MVTPGNAGNPWSNPADPADIEADLYLIGPEQHLVDGLADRLRAAGHLVFGPGADGARLEGSKAWMKQVLAEAGVPTARYGAFTEAAPALAFLDSLGPPYVVKTDGLAAGKGVLVTGDRAEAAEDVRAKLAGTSFGAAGTTVVIEEGLSGPELSVLAVCDGRRALALAPARDHKRVGAGDTGPNTGGMGAYAPVPGVDTGAVLEEAVLPTLGGAAAAGDRLPRGAVRRADADRRRAEGARVQRALRRPRGPGGRPGHRRPGGPAGLGRHRAPRGTSPPARAGPPWPWSAPRRATPGPSGRATPSTDSTRSTPSTASRSSAAASDGARTGDWSPPAGGSWP